MARVSPESITEKEAAMLNALRRWREQNRKNGPKVRTSDGMLDPLGRWLNDQRARYRQGTIRPAVLEQLQRMGYDFHAPTDAPAQLPALLPPAKCNCLESLFDAGFRFPVLYADPPWRYGNQGTRGSTKKHYVTMATEEIAAMPVQDLAADNAYLFLWTTHSFLEDSFGILRSWGFTYKSQFVWVKNRMGLGNYARICHELLLVAVRGNPQPFTRRNARSNVAAPMGKHSAKPEIFREIIESVTVGLEPRLELFGRRTAAGWTVFGNEVEDDLFSVGEPATTRPEVFAEEEDDRFVGAEDAVVSENGDLDLVSPAVAGERDWRDQLFF